MSYKVAYLLNSSQIGGGNHSMLTLWQGLCDMPIKPLAFCPAQGPMTEMLKDKGLSYYIQPYFQPSWKKPIQTYNNWKRWIKHFRRNSLALVHANNLYGGRSIALAARRLRIPFLCHVRFPPEREFCFWAFRKLPKPDGFIFNSKALQGEVGPLLEDSCPKTRQWVVYNAIDISKFKISLNNENRIPRIGIVANFHPVKGHEDFLLMASLLTKKEHKVIFDIVGDDIYESGRMQKLKEMAYDLGVADKTIFHGHLKNVVPIMNKLDILVCSSHMETFGRCIIEAMACGKPVVATKVGGIPEVVVDQQTGLLVPPKDPVGLAKATESLLTNRERRKIMGLKGRERVENKFSVKEHAQAMLNIYKEFLKGL